MCLTPGSSWSTNRLNQPSITGSCPPSASQCTQPFAPAGRNGSLPNRSMSSTSIVRWNLKAAEPSRLGCAPRAKSVSPNVM